LGSWAAQLAEKTPHRRKARKRMTPHLRLSLIGWSCIARSI